MNAVRLILLIGLVLLFTACGKKGPVRPLEAKLPDAVKNVELLQRGDELLLGWQLPTRNQDGTPLAAKPVVDIYRMLFDPDDDCPECMDRSTLLYSIDPELPQPARLSNDRYLLRDRQVTADNGYHYRLVPRNPSGQAGRPLIVRIIVTSPTAAPPGLRVEAHDRSATLSWQPIRLEAGQELLGYRVYRWQPEDEQLATLLNQVPLTDLTFEDLNMENNKRYVYQIRALLKQDDQLLESLPTTAVQALPQAAN